LEPPAPLKRLPPEARVSRPPPREPLRAPPQPRPPKPSDATAPVEETEEPKQSVMDRYREKFATANADERDVWPYPKHIYLLRLVWFIVWKTIWKFCWRRVPILRTALLRVFGAKVKYAAMSASTWIEMPWDLELGDHVLVGPRVHLYNLGGLSIGDHTVLSQDVYVCGGTHDYTDPSYPLIRKKIAIGNYVWIAAGAFIHPGVKIGDGAVIGARAVVTRDVAPWTIVSGNPAKFIKARVIHSVAQQQVPPMDAQLPAGPEVGPSV
jgi:putative colanic acid biosynthesis acetyltransferase WcaF